MHICIYTRSFIYVYMYMYTYVYVCKYIRPHIVKTFPTFCSVQS